MDCVRREALAGFRPPVRAEKEGALRYLRKSFARTLRAMSLGTAFFGVMAGSCLVTLTIGLADRSAGENMVTAVILAVSAAAVWWIRVCRKQKQRILRKVAAGDFQVAECTVYQVSFNVDLVSEADVKIADSLGQRCDFKFVLDAETARTCERDRDTKVLLLKCEEDFYELLSEFRMGSR